MFFRNRRCFPPIGPRKVRRSKGAEKVVTGLTAERAKFSAIAEQSSMHAQPSAGCDFNLV